MPCQQTRAPLWQKGNNVSVCSFWVIDTKRKCRFVHSELLIPTESVGLFILSYWHQHKVSVCSFWVIDTNTKCNQRALIWHNLKTVRYIDNCFLTPSQPWRSCQGDRRKGEEGKCIHCLTRPGRIRSRQRWHHCTSQCEPLPSTGGKGRKASV